MGVKRENIRGILFPDCSLISCGSVTLNLPSLLDVVVRFSFVAVGVFENIDVHMSAYVAYFLYESAH